MPDVSRVRERTRFRTAHDSYPECKGFCYEPNDVAKTCEYVCKNDDPQCADGEIWNPILKECTQGGDTLCPEGEVWNGTRCEKPVSGPGIIDRADELAVPLALIGVVGGAAAYVHTK